MNPQKPNAPGEGRGRRQRVNCRLLIIANPFGILRSLNGLALVDDHRGPQRHRQQYERRGHENCKAKDDHIDERMNEAVGNP